MKINPLNVKLKHALRIDRALRFVWQAAPGYTLFSGIVIGILGTLPLVSLYLVKLIIDSVSDIIFNTTAGNIPDDFNMSVLYICLAGGVAFLTAFFNFISFYLKKAQSLTVTDYMFSILQKKSLEVDLAYFESPRYKDTLHQAQREGPYRPTSIVNGLSAAGQSGTSFAAVSCMLFVFNPLFPLVMIAASIPGILMRLNYSKKIYAWQQKRTEDERRAFYFNWILTSDLHVKELRLFNCGKYFVNRFREIRNFLKNEQLWFEKRRAFCDFVAQSSATIAVFGSFIYIAARTIQGTITIGDMVMYFQAFQRGLIYLKSLLESGAQMYEDNLFLSNLYDFLKLEPQIIDPEYPVKIPEKIITGIEFKNVKFSYHNCKKRVIKCVSFFIKPGEIVALVGENGSGKSTIVKLLARLYDPDDGAILLDGQDIKNFRIDDYRKKISAVFQDYIKYHLSAGENIYLGDIEQKEDFEKIMAATRQAGADKKILSLSRGYDTILGRWFKKGEELSIGQWQMIAIARAFFRNSELVLFDEPSSALDPETEMKIFSKLKELIKDRSALIISHRYSTVKMADKILVMDKGSIVEQGSHEELMGKDGNYALLYNTYINSYL